MSHQHYSPFQFATGVEAVTGHVNATKVVKTLKKLTSKDEIRAKASLSTMSREHAHMIPGSPTAFISPNSVDAMRSIKSVFGNC